jgi:hypothetical protein
MSQMLDRGNIVVRHFLLLDNSNKKNVMSICSILAYYSAVIVQHKEIQADEFMA